MRSFNAVLAGVACAALLLPAAAEAKPSKVVIKNKSDWEIHHLFLSPTDDDQWGADQLGEHVIEPGEAFELKGVPCDSYDVKLVDEDGDECEIADVDICGGSQGWVIDNDDLLECEGY